jgi:hypothetical protein
MLFSLFNRQKDNRQHSVTSSWTRRRAGFAPGVEHVEDRVLLSGGVEGVTQAPQDPVAIVAEVRNLGEITQVTVSTSPGLGELPAASDAARLLAVSPQTGLTQLMIELQTEQKRVMADLAGQQTTLSTQGLALTQLQYQLSNAQAQMAAAQAAHAQQIVLGVSMAMAQSNVVSVPLSGLVEVEERDLIPNTDRSIELLKGDMTSQMQLVDGGNTQKEPLELQDELRGNDDIRAQRDKMAEELRKSLNDIVNAIQ